jgi:hypothetical protein
MHVWTAAQVLSQTDVISRRFENAGLPVRKRLQKCFSVFAHMAAPRPGRKGWAHLPHEPENGIFATGGDVTGAREIFGDGSLDDEQTYSHYCRADRAGLERERMNSGSFSLCARLRSTFGG